ncbi:MAG: MarR family transcriptional regulator [Dehalococcoidia bacterium]|nr:winged helix DNA-binding protein [Dehalococcoidia bacterium]MCB9486190.1 winged helix DNA-binding protein [Thermoflexaceae bacterium]
MEDSERASDLDLVTALYRTTNTVVRELDQRLTREHDVTFVQAVTLLAIESFEQPQPHLVAQYLSQQSQTVTGVLDRIERAGLIERLRDMSDRRAVRLVLTEKGERLVTQLRQSLGTSLHDVLAGVGPGTRQRLGGDLAEVERSAMHPATQ